MDIYSVVARVADRGGLVLALGGLDSGKSTFCRMAAEVATRLGRSVAYVDTDIAQSTIGPPTTIGLKYITSNEDLEPERLARPDALSFVGAISPEHAKLSMILGALRVVEQARASGAHLIVVDTTGFIDGLEGQTLKLAKVEALRPDMVVGFQRGGELEPILGAIRRAFPPEVEGITVDAAVLTTTVEERAAHRQARLRAAFEPPLYNWKVKPSVLVPAIPPSLDPAGLDRVLVGMEDGKGSCIGLGILEDRDGLRMISTLDEGAKALRLGAVRVLPDFRTTPIDLRELFFFA